MATLASEDEDIITATTQLVAGACDRARALLLPTQASLDSCPSEPPDHPQVRTGPAYPVTSSLPPGVSSVPLSEGEEGYDLMMVRDVVNYRTGCGLFGQEGYP